MLLVRSSQLEVISEERYGTRLLAMDSTLDCRVDNRNDDLDQYSKYTKNTNIFFKKREIMLKIIVLFVIAVITIFGELFLISYKTHMQAAFFAAYSTLPFTAVNIALIPDIHKNNFHE